MVETTDTTATNLLGLMPDVIPESMPDRSQGAFFVKRKLRKKEKTRNEYLNSRSGGSSHVTFSKICKNYRRVNSFSLLLPRHFS
jgi:hypothetical protein